MFKIINISGSSIGLIKVVKGKIEQENLDPSDYRVVDSLSDQVKRLADPSLKIIKVLNEEVRNLYD